MTQGISWDGIENAETRDRGKYFKPNFDGVVRVRRTIGKETRKSGMAFLVEFDVEITNLPEDHPVGSKGTWMRKMATEHDRELAFPVIVEWAAACLNIEKHEKDAMEELKKEIKGLMRVACENPDDNVFSNSRIRLVTTQVKTKADTDFTVHDFSPVAQ